MTIQPKTNNWYPDCGDNSCRFCPPEYKGGMRTNGGCRCISKVSKTEAVRDGTKIALYWKERALKAENELKTMMKNMEGSLLVWP